MALLSKGRLSKMVLEILLEFPFGQKYLKENVTLRLGMIGQLSTTRDISAAWNEAKKKAVKLHPENFILDGRNVIHWNDGSIKVLDKKFQVRIIKNLMNYQMLKIVVLIQ